MAQETTIQCVENQWTELTNADVTALTFQVQGSGGAMIKRGTTVMPDDDEGAYHYSLHEGELNVALDTLSPGGTGSRVWAMSTNGLCRVSVSHA